MREYSRTLLKLKEDKQSSSSHLLLEDSKGGAGGGAESKDNKATQSYPESKSEDKAVAEAKSSRPAWAMTEGKAEIIKEAKKEVSKTCMSIGMN
ncbi:hypothetical protein EON65_47755 [archaeon]|nr:MAG: hypothetical protein EON65_47755 [archaeon]